MSQNINMKLAMCFVTRTRFGTGNSAVVMSGEDRNFEVYMLLHGNKIASWCPHYNSFYTTLAGYNTMTTKSRLNTLIGIMYDRNFIPYCETYYQRKGKLYLGDGARTRCIEDHNSIQWHVAPPIGGSHPGMLSHVRYDEVIIQKPKPVQLTFEQYMEVLI